MSDIKKVNVDLPNLPAVPDGWVYRELNELLQDNGLSYGIVQPGSEDLSGIPIIRVKNVRNGRIISDDVLHVSPEIEAAHKRTRLHGGEVLLSLVGSVGQVAIAPSFVAGWNVARAIAVIRASDASQNAWIKICLESDLAQRYMHIWQTTTVQATLNLRDVRRLPISIPPMMEREAILNVIGALDSKITVNDRIAEVSDALISARFGEIVLSDSKRTTVRLDDVAEVNNKKASPTPGGVLRYIDISSVETGNIEWPDLESWDEAPGRARRGASPGDTIWSTVRPNRRSFALILDEDPAMVFSTGFAVLTPVKIGPAFLYEVAKQDEFVQYLESVAEGSAYPAVRAERFKQAPVPLPTPERLDKFESVAMPVRRRAHAALVESRSLTALRDTLLPKLMSGEIRVRDAEKVVEDVT